jgi:hypothetical protein
MSSDSSSSGRIFGSPDIEDLGEEHGHRVLLVHGKSGKDPRFAPPSISTLHWLNPP